MIAEIDKWIYSLEYKSDTISDKDLHSVIDNASKALESNDKLEDVEIMKLYYLLGIGLFRINQYDKSSEHLNITIQYGKKLFDEYYLAKAYGWNSINYLNIFSIKEYEECFNIAENKLRYLRQYDDLAVLCTRVSCNLYRGQRSKDEIQAVLNKTEGYLKKFESSLSAQCYLGIGQIYSLVLNNFDAAVDHYYRALELARKYDVPRIECTVLYQIGAGYCQLNLKNECIGIFRQMLVDRRFEEFYVIQSASAIELIRVLIEKEMHLDKIETYIKKCEKAIDKIGLIKGQQFKLVFDITIINYNIRIKKHDVKQYLSKMKEIEEKYYSYGNTFLFTNFDYDIQEVYGEIYYKLKEYDKALKHHKLLLNLANKYEVTFLIKAYNYLARDYEAVGDYKEAYFYIEKANKAIVEIEHRELVRKYVRVYKNYERLRGQEKEKHDFFATLSHELKTPINVIYSTIQLLNLFKDRDEQEFKNIYLKYEKSLKQNCLRMNRLVNNIIDLTKLDSGALNPNFVNYDIVKLTKDIAESVLSYVEINNVNLTFSSSIEEFIIICDPTFIERIVLNLLSNAIKFSKEKGNIDVNVYLKDKYVVLEVKDNGIGIPITMQQKIFERFVQLDKSLSRKKEGSGIGLSLVKILVEIHNGYIELESKEGNGSIFRVYLPNENDNSMIKVKSCNEYNVNIERVYAELSDIYELI